MSNKIKKPERYEDEFTACFNECFSQQMSAHRGFKEFGERAVVAMIKELKQLDQGAVQGNPVVEEVDPDTLSKEDKIKALDVVNLIELKRDGAIKGRSCANGSKQRSYLK